MGVEWTSAVFVVQLPFILFLASLEIHPPPPSNFQSMCFLLKGRVCDPDVAHPLDTDGHII